jgi:hypothetical protein
MVPSVCLPGAASSRASLLPAERRYSLHDMVKLMITGNRRRFTVIASALVLLASAMGAAQAVPGTVHRFLPLQLQSPDVVIYQMQQFLIKRAAGLPQPKNAEEWTSEAQRIRQHVLNDVIYHGWPKDWIDSAPKFEDMGAVPVPAGAGYRSMFRIYSAVTYIETSTSQCLKRWRSVPSLLSRTI